MNIIDGNNNEQINFSVSVPEWKNTDSLSSSKTSRATPIQDASFGADKSFNLIADQNGGVGNYSTLINSQVVTCTNSIWKTSSDYYWSGIANKTINFYAYYPTSIFNLIPHSSAGSTPAFSYTIPDNVTNQIDIMTATSTNVPGNTVVPTSLTFKHIFAAIQFSVGSGGIGSGTISSISIGNVANSGTYTFGSGWSNVTGSKTFTISQSKTITGTSGEDIYSGTYTLMMIPQAINNVTITITYSNGSTLTKAISGTWGAGIVYKYNLSYLPRNFAYTGAVQTYTAPVTGTYKLEVWGAEGSVKGGYSSGTKSLNAGQTIYIYVGGKNSDGSYLNGDGATDIRLNGLIYTPPLAYQGNVNACYYGPYWRNSIGTYQVDATGSGFDKCSFTAYNYSPSHSFTVTNVTKTAYHFTAYINVDIDVSSASYSGIELIVAWDGTKYNVTISNIAISKLSDRIIIGAGYNSSNSTSGVANGTSQEHINSGNGMAKITLLSVP
ncbi:fimbrillin family protein [Prevotella herbatica]|uniref:Fimbrillin family protein n=2 Tax=Prevotella herbatica TaxID=2801997 RepID=A0ABM7NZE9_9BACT|nr:fimbrillin family protein [Prevotella herbatica]